MNYYYIKNDFEIIKYDYLDKFDIKIYYLNEDYCQININRTDSDTGWGLILKIIIYDIYNHNIFDLIEIGNSDKNWIYKTIKTNVKLEYDKNNKVKIEKIIYPREDFFINNKYDLIKNDNNYIDLHLVIYYLNDYEIKIIIRRLDEECGWSNNLKLILYEDSKKEIITIGPSNENFKYIFKNTKIKMFKKENEYFQEIPKIIFQTGYDNVLKSVLHFNSIMTFIELNPEYCYKYFTNDESRIFLRKRFSEEVNNSYDILVPGAYKADLLRYCFLYDSGGCYFDCKQILRVPIRNFLDSKKKLVLCNDVIEKALLNAVIFSTAKNIVIQKAIKDCVYNLLNKLGTNALGITGPIFFYKSIKKYINSDNLILQNTRPIDNFNDFSTDYYGNSVKMIENNMLILNRFYKGYYNNYLNTNHYGKLFILNEIYYKNFKNIENCKIGVYPNKFNDQFDFTINNNILNIKRVDSLDGWYFNLKIIIINQHLREYPIEVGLSKSNSKDINISDII